MIDRPAFSADPLARDRMVIVADRVGGQPMLDELCRRYPDWDVARCDSYLSGILELSRRGARAVLACVDPSHAQIGQAVAGLRRAAGSKTKLILCCSATNEPIARAVRARGADAYVLYPFDDHDLDAVLEYPRTLPPQDLSAAPPVSTEELMLLGEALSSISDTPMALLEKLAKLIRRAMAARGATIVVQGAAATDGQIATAPVMSVPLMSESSVVGQITLAPRDDGPYAPVDVQKLNHYAAVVGHVLQAASKQREWSRLAVTDECSGMPNRRYLTMKLDEVLARATREHFQVTVLFFDVDDFKTYNDTFGHDAGDEIIREIGALIREQCREQDIVARYGGDEFAVVFWDAEGARVAGSSHPGCALGVLDRFRDALKTKQFPRSGPTGSGRLTISGGLATYPWDAATRETLIKRADEALLAAKRAGKNRIFLIGQDETTGPERS